MEFNPYKPPKKIDSGLPSPGQRPPPKPKKKNSIEKARPLSPARSGAPRSIDARPQPQEKPAPPPTFLAPPGPPLPTRSEGALLAPSSISQTSVQSEPALSLSANESPAKRKAMLRTASLAATIASVSGKTWKFIDYKAGNEARGKELALALERKKPYGPVLREGPLRKVNRGGPRRYLFVLSIDALLYCRGLNEKQLELNQELAIEQVATLEGDDSCSFQIQSPGKSFLAIADTPGECTSWRIAIQSAAEARRALLGVKIADSFAPVWTEDKETDGCMLCGSEFTLLKRRHHCRKCGKLVCHACSGEKIKLRDPSGTFSFQRVCNPCHASYVDNRSYGIDDRLSYNSKMISRLNETQSKHLTPPRPTVQEEAPSSPALPPRAAVPIRQQHDTAPPPPPPQRDYHESIVADSELKQKRKSPPPPPPRRDYNVSDTTFPIRSAQQQPPPPPASSGGGSPGLAAARKAAAAVKANNPFLAKG